MGLFKKILHPIKTIGNLFHHNDNSDPLTDMMNQEIENEKNIEKQKQLDTYSNEIQMIKSNGNPVFSQGSGVQV